MRLMLSAIIVVCAVGFSTWFFWPKGDTQVCEEKEVSEVVGCGGEDTDSGCAYQMTDGSLDANDKGLKVGDKVQVCRNP